MANSKIITYEDFVERYDALVKNAEEIENELRKIRFSLKPSIVSRRKKLRECFEEVEARIEDYERFVTNTCTYDTETFISFMTKFYSFYYNTKLKVIEIFDNSRGKYAEHAYLVVTADDYVRLKREFNFDKAVNSRKVLAKCKHEEFLYLSGKAKTTLMNGVGLEMNPDFEQFGEIETVLHTAIAYKLNNRDLKNRACLQIALDDYIRMNQDKHYTSPVLETYENIRRSALDSDLVESISRTVQQVMDEEVTKEEDTTTRMKKQASTMAQRQTGARATQEVKPVGQLEQTKPMRRNMSVGSSMLFMLDSIIKLDEDKETGMQMPQQPNETRTQIFEQPKVTRTHVSQQPREMKTQEFRQARHEQTVEFKPVRVAKVEEAPVEKRTQYKASSSVLLGMLDNMVTLEDDGKHLKK